LFQLKQEKIRIRVYWLNNPNFIVDSLYEKSKNCSLFSVKTGELKSNINVVEIKQSLVFGSCTLLIRHVVVKTVEML